MISRFAPLLCVLILTACNGATLRDPYPFYNNLDTAFRKSANAAEDCADKVEEGELLGTYGLTNCRAQVLHKELQKAGYPYMDLADDYVFTVREAAMQVDCGETEPAVATAQMKRAYHTWLKEEARRCEIDNVVKLRREPSSMDPRWLLDRRTFQCYGLHTEQGVN